MTLVSVGIIMLSECVKGAGSDGSSDVAGLALRTYTIHGYYTFASRD